MIPHPSKSVIADLDFDHSFKSVPDLDIAIDIACELTVKITESQDLRQKVLHLISTDDFASPLRDLVASDQHEDSARHHVNGICYARFAALLHTLRKRLYCLILHTRLQTSASEENLDPALGRAILEKHIDPEPKLQVCTLLPRPESKGISIFETHGTPQERASQAWRERLTDILSRDAQHQHQSIVRIIDDVCRDLEARCSDAERPYREEQAKTISLELQVQSLQKGLAESNTKHKRLMHDVNDLKDENSRLREEVNNAQLRMENDLEEIEDWKQACEKQKLAATHTKNALSEAARKQDLVYMETLTANQEELERRNKKINDLESQAYSLNEQIGHAVTLKEKATEDIKSCEATLYQRSKELQEALDSSAERQREVDLLIQSKSALAANIEALQSNVCDWTLNPTDLVCILTVCRANISDGSLTI